MLAAAREAAAAGDLERAIDLTLAVSDLGDHLLARPILIDTMIGVAMRSMAAQELRTMLARNRGTWSGGDRRRVATSRFATARIPSAVELCEPEWTGMIDAMNQLFTVDGDGDGRLILDRVQTFVRASTAGPKGLLDRLRWSRHAGRRATLDKMEELRDVSIDIAEGRRPASDMDLEMANTDPDRYALPLATPPREMRVFLSIWSCKIERDATLACLALDAYFAQHGAWPERAEQLVPDHLDALPLDSDGAPLDFVPSNDGQPPRWTSRTLKLDPRR